MKYLHRLVAVASAAIFIAGSALAQNAGTVTNHAFALGAGPGGQGYTSLLCTSAQIAVGQAAADPICRTITGDVTISAAGVTAIGAAKVTNTMIAGMTSAQLAAILSDETGTGLAVFQTAPVLITPTISSGGANYNGSTSGTTTLKGNPIASGTLTLPAATDTLVGRATTDTLTNKSINGANNPITNVSLATGVAGNLPLANIAIGTQDTALGYWGSTAASALAVGNCSNALTYSTTTHTFGCNTTAGTGTVTSVTCGTGLSGGTITASGTCALALNSATLQATPTAPTGTTSIAQVMSGLGTTCKLTPVYSGRIKFEFLGATRNTAANTTVYNAMWGTGTAPANGVAATGTAVGPTVASTSPTSTSATPFSAGGIITGLTPGTAYWFDISQATAGGGTSNLTNLTCNAMEF